MAPTSEFEYKKYLLLIISRKYLFVTVALAIMTLSVIATYLIPPRYEAKCTVFIEKSVISDLVKGIAVTPSSEDKIRVLTYAMKSRNLLLKVANDLDLNVGNRNDAQLEAMVSSFQGNTDIKLKDKEGLFIISFHDQNPRLARDYVNTLARRYIEENVSSKREDSYDATRFLAEQIETVRTKLDKADTEVSRFRQEKGGLLATASESITREIDDAQQRIDEINIKRNQLKGMLALVRKNDPLQAKLATLQKKLSDLNIVYTDSYPEVIEVKAEIAAVTEQIKSGRGLSETVATQPQESERIAMELRTLGELENNQRRIIAAKRSMLRSIPAAKASLEDLERERSTQKNLYEQLMARHGQSEVAKQMEVQDKTTTFRIVDPAVLPVKPTSPNRVKFILLGILAGLAGSFALLVLVDYLDNSVRDVDELKSLGVPVLAIVPKIKSAVEQGLARKHDIRFFAVAGTYFSLILAILSVELLRNFSIEIMNPTEIHQSLTGFMNRWQR